MNVMFELLIACFLVNFIFNSAITVFYFSFLDIGVNIFVAGVHTSPSES